MKPIVAIVGRPNVGKSTLFNRLTRSKMAIVEDYPGVTRDRLYQDAEWNNRKFTLIDTGGIEVKSDDTILAQVRTQAQVAMEEADVIIFMCDIKAGVTNEDMEIAQMLRRTKKDVILAVNKVENFDHLEDLYEFYTLGLDEPYPISASHGMNTGDLLDRLMELIDKYEEEEYEPDVIKIAVVGRPNVGKSSLTNAILGQERAIVSNIPGTTRDAIDTPFERNGQQYVIIDTAGMRRKSKVAETTTERYSVIRSLRAVDRADAVLMVINAEEGLIEQDKKIVGYAHEQGKAIILVVNKWDLIEKDDKTSATMEKEIRSELLFLQYAPMIFVSAMTKQCVHKLIDMINRKAISGPNPQLARIAENKKLVHYLDMPLQHADGEILKRMNRRGDRETLAKLIEKIRTKIPDITLRTTFITGFPGETDEQFCSLHEFVKEIRFDRLGCFTYSAEEDTVAALFENQVDEQVKTDRMENIMELQMTISAQKNEEKIGTITEVLIEGWDDYIKCYFGRTLGDAPEVDGKIFFLSTRPLKIGDFVKVRINDCIEYDLLGELEE